MPDHTVLAIARDVTTGRSTALASASAALARADAYDAIQPQAWIQRRSADEVLRRAQEVDARRARGESLPLAGVPFAVKDNIDAAGLPTTAGCPAFAFLPERSATVVERLEQAGALLLGKTNLDQFATGLVGTRSPYGIPACVYNREFISGGSSSGSAVVVAAGVVPFALGTDTAGSGRVPAAINHLVGFKPTRGRFSTRGVFPACRSIDCVSVFTADARDAAMIDGVLASLDEADPYARRAPAEPSAWSGPPRLGIARPDQRQFFGDLQSATLYERALMRLAATGARLVEVDIEPLLAAAQLLYAGPWVAERLAVTQEFLRRQPGAMHPVVRAIIQSGQGYTAVDAFRGLYALQEHGRAAQKLWQQVDVLALPTAPTVYRIADVLAEPVLLNSNLGYYTNFVNLLDMSAVSLPAGFRANDTGFGISLIGPAWTDRALLGLAAQYETARRQGGDDAGMPELDLAPRAPHIALAVAGAHLSGMALNHQLSARGARLVRATQTAPLYRLYAMAGALPPKPALRHVGAGGSAIEVEIYELEPAAFGQFVAEVPPPLAIGTLTLADGSAVSGFVAEPRALEGARDITAHGGWRAFLASQAP